jgi:NAD(P)-dependent dehydrogenase (short-subunit alcohol dehydrogenase family)
MGTVTDTITAEPSSAATLTRTAIVTGGAGGIGSAISRRLATAGYAVVVADADVDAAELTAATLPGVDGAEHRGFAGDLTDSAVNRALAEAAAAEAPIGVIVNAVGISPKRDGRKISFFEMTDEEWNRVMAVNVSAPFFITAKLGAGGAPDAVFPPHLPSTVAYAASKAALQNLTASLSRELAGHRIRVNGVAPGFVQTPMMGEVPPEGPLLDQVPMRRFARPEEIADAVAFLVSDQASYVTGTSLDVNGGWLTC